MEEIPTTRPAATSLHTRQEGGGWLLPTPFRPARWGRYYPPPFRPARGGGGYLPPKEGGCEKGGEGVLVAPLPPVQPKGSGVTHP